MSSKADVWTPYKDEDGYEQAVQYLFFQELAPRLLKSKHLKFDRTVLARAWNLQVESQSRARNSGRKKPLSLIPEFYVYVLMDPRKPGSFEYVILGKKLILPYEPFYIGKGTRDRVKDHCKKVFYKPQDHKSNKIKKIREVGLEPVEKIISQPCIESISLIKEQVLIRSIGQFSTGEGPLTNKTSGGEGTSGLIQSKTHRSRIGRANKGKCRSLEVRVHLSVLKTGKPLSAETREKMRVAHLGKKRKPHSEETKRKIGNRSRGRKHSEESKTKMSLTRKGKIFARVTCPHCGKTGGINNMNRSHFDKCGSLDNFLIKQLASTK